MGLLKRWSSRMNIHDDYYYVSYTSLRDSVEGGGSELDDNTWCLMQFRLNDWSDAMRIAFFALFWHLPLILWLLPWKTQYPTINTSLQALFQSAEYGLSLQHWKRVGKVTGARMKTLAGSFPFETWVRVYIALIGASMITKTLLFLSIAKPQSMENYNDLYQSEPIHEFVNGQTILIAMMFIGDWFILMADAPSRLLKNVPIHNSGAKVVGRILTMQVLCTTLMLVYKWKIFSVCCVIALALMITLRVIGMATFFFLPAVASIGLVFYGFFRAMFEPIARRRGNTYWNHRAREWTSACVWLCMTWLAWTTCFAMVLLFFNPRFDSVICLDISSKPALGTFFFQMTMVLITIVTIYIFGVIDSVKWNMDKLGLNSLLYGFRCRNMKQFDNLAKSNPVSQKDTESSVIPSQSNPKERVWRKGNQQIVFASQASHISKDASSHALTSDTNSDGRLSQVSLDEELMSNDDDSDEVKHDSDNENAPLIGNRQHDATGAVV